MYEANLENALFDEMSTDTNYSIDEDEIIPFKDNESLDLRRIRRPNPTSYNQWVI